jgi:hypothetical protein
MFLLSFSNLYYFHLHSTLFFLERSKDFIKTKDMSLFAKSKNFKDAFMSIFNKEKPDHLDKQNILNIK